MFFHLPVIFPVTTYIVILYTLMYTHSLSAVHDGSTPVQVSTRSITQYPLTGMYCLVIIFIASCATIPPRNAATFGRSAVGARTISPTASEISFSPSSVLGIKDAICSRSSLSVGPPVCLGGDDRHASSAKKSQMRGRFPRQTTEMRNEFLWCSV